MNQRLTKLFLVASYAALSIAKAGAADYAAGFAINAAASHDDNIRLVKGDKTAVDKYGLSPTLTFGINTETTKAQLNSTLSFNRYDKSEFNSDDQNIALALSRQFENSSVGLDVDFIHNSTNTSELLTSGRIGTKAERAEQYTLSPNWIYTVTETNLIQLTANYTIQNYGNIAYTGYKDTGAEFDGIHVINERTKLIVAATYSDIKYDDTKLEVPFSSVIAFHLLFPAGVFGEQSYAARTKSNGAQAGVDYQWSEQSLIKARLGRSQSRSSYDVKDPDQICTNSIYQQLVAAAVIGSGACNLQPSSGPLTTSSLIWTWSGESQQFGLNATKATQPTANGYTVDALQIGSNWSYQLSELNKILASVALVRNRAIDKKNSLQNTSIADRDYGSATLQYQRQLSEYWFLTAGFQFSEQKYTQIDYQASSRVYSLNISYRPQQWHWAR